MIAVVSGAIINIIFNAILIPRYSYNGAAIGTVIAEITQFVIQIILAKEMVIQVFDIKQPLKAVVGAVIASIVVGCFKFYMNFTNLFLELLLLAFVFFVVYILIMYLLKYSLLEYFKKMIINKIKRR